MLFLVGSQPRQSCMRDMVVMAVQVLVPIGKRRVEYKRVVCVVAQLEEHPSDKQCDLQRASCVTGIL